MDTATICALSFKLSETRWGSETHRHTRGATWQSVGRRAESLQITDCGTAMAGTFTGDKSMSVNYALGVDRYYAETGEDYRNPHYAGIQQATACIMGSWWPLLLGMRSQSQPQGTMPLGGSPMATPPPPATASLCSDVAAAPPQLLGSVHVLDLAAGSGEATQALQAWWSAPPAITGGSGSRSGTRRPTAAITPPIRALSGAEPSSSLPPPSLPSPLSSGLQLCVDAADPYTHRAYAKQVGRPAELFTFQDVADGCLSERAYHLCICRWVHTSQGRVWRRVGSHSTVRVWINMVGASPLSERACHL